MINLYKIKGYLDKDKTVVITEEKVNVLKFNKEDFSITVEDINKDQCTLSFGEVEQYIEKKETYNKEKCGYLTKKLGKGNVYQYNIESEIKELEVYIYTMKTTEIEEYKKEIREYLEKMLNKLNSMNK